MVVVIEVMNSISKQIVEESLWLKLVVMNLKIDIRINGFFRVCIIFIVLIYIGLRGMVELIICIDMISLVMISVYLVLVWLINYGIRQRNRVLLQI